MRRSLILALVLIAALALPAAADQVSLTLTGTGSNSSNNEITYPYYFTIGNQTGFALMCDTMGNNVSIGQSWTANTVSLANGGIAGLFAGTVNGTQSNYNQAGLIFLGVLNGSIDASAGNWAVWDFTAVRLQVEQNQLVTNIA